MGAFLGKWVLISTFSPGIGSPLEPPLSKQIHNIFSLLFWLKTNFVTTKKLLSILFHFFHFSGSSPAVQFNIQSNAVVCTSNATTSNAAEEIEIANSTEENHVYDSVIYTGYQTFQPKTSEDLTETINSNATSISDLSIQPETSESLTESIPTSIADQTTVNEMNK
ncbi:uncharacterized protein LOC129926724 isoform X2 [Biomphalaria glabrata]|uniref:Uncharacterized protein LOC129926724 isoform X2 n=1 Tax=Biomphalaria glabrata TaxID=6526 RepID=A0A9W3AMF6_BIOGL|nr:uncharacterized protein LOC129926724 isoform X2 [Biomphalaria glabrata]